MAADRRSKMSRADRAKQFMPFDALKGFREALKVKEAVYLPRRELSAEQIETINIKLQLLHKNDRINVEFYQNGNYLKVASTVRRLDKINKFLSLEDLIISIENISDLQIL